MMMMFMGINAWAEEVTGVISFGTNNVKINASSVTGDDNLGNTWTIKTVGTSSYTANTGYYQVGSSNKPATSITFTMSLPNDVTIKSMAATFGGFNGTAGNVNLKVDDSTIGTGSLSGQDDVQISSSTTAEGKVLTVAVTNISKGVKVYKITYTYDNESSDNPVTVTAPKFDVAAGTYTEDQLVLVDNYNNNYLYFYTTDGTTPACDEELNATGTSLVYDNEEGIEVTESCTLKMIAVDEDGNTSSVTSAAYVINKPIVFTSLEELVAADITTGTIVSVSFENVPIKSFYTNSNNVRTGVFFDIQKGGKDIEIYYYGVPSEWEVGGTLSGTMTCPWKNFNGTWELAPASGWSWTNLTYNAPVARTLTAITVSGTPAKTTYVAGEALDPKGLVVTGTYNIGEPSVITSGIEWTFNPETLSEGATTCDVMANVGEVLSDVYIVTGLTVMAPKALTTIELTGTPSKTTYCKGEAFSTAGLGVSANYNYGDPEDVTANATFEVTPATFEEVGEQKVTVVAKYEDKTVSHEYTVNVTNDSKVTYEFSSFTSNATVELTDFDGFVITLSKNEGSTNPTWSSNQARVYAKGSLTVKANNAAITSIAYDYVVNKNKNGVAPTIDRVSGKTDDGIWDADAKTWTGSDDEVTFSTSGSAGNIGFTSLTITYAKSNKVETSLAWSAEEATVTINASDNIFPTLTVTPADLEGVMYTSSNTKAATIDETTGLITLVAPGKTEITASYAGDATHTSSTASYTLTVNKAPFVPVPVEDGYEIVNFAALSPYKDLETNGSADMRDYEGTSFAMAFAKREGTNNAPKYYENGNAVRAYVGNKVTITAAEPIKDVDVAWVSGYIDNAVSIEGVGTTTAVITFSKTCRFTHIGVAYATEALITNANGVASYVTSLPADFTNVEGLTAYLCTETSSETVTLEKAGKVPAGTALVVVGGKSTSYDLPFTASATAVENLFLAGEYTVQEGDFVYALNTQGQFQKVGTGVTIPARKAYLKTEEALSKTISIFDVDETTGIASVNNEAVKTTARKVIINGQLRIVTLNGIFTTTGAQVK